MSHEIPVFAFPVELARVASGMDSDEALALAPEEPKDLWMATSRNWWYQGFLTDVLGAYEGFSELGYLLQDLALVRPEWLASRASQLRALVRAIYDRPQGFLGLSMVSETPESLRGVIEEAYVSRNLDDDSQLAFGNFFSFLLSQAAALEEAHSSGKALLYVQPQPDHSPSRLP